ncbi:crotonobetainyl-CoA:carnitine CoA-transferase [Sphingomonas sp. SRS2]|nr:crotonobetainyl-CoA:carnitine CoA-transferase [Sphingomonas sp. SRS2]
MLQRQAAIDGGGPLWIGGTNYSFSDLSERAAAMAAVLRDAGIGQGDRVAIQCGNRIEFLDIFFGCAWINAVAVPVNRAARGQQLQHVLADSGATLFAADSDGVAALFELDQQALSIRTVWQLDTECEFTAPRPWTMASLPPLGAKFAPCPTTLPSDTAAILYTSGTTGPSKGVCCPHAQFFWWGLLSIDTLETRADDRLLTTLPLFHSNALGCVFKAMLSGASLSVLERFSASNFTAELRRHGATMTYLLGAMVSILLSRPVSETDRDHPCPRAFVPGVSEALAEQFLDRFGIAAFDGYGSTETNFVIGDRPGTGRPGSMGRIRPGFSARVVDTDDNELPPGVAGELVLRSDLPFATSTGYYGLPAATVASWRNLWFHTGDRVVCDADGRFSFVDRIKDVIRRRGENISAFEVEQVLLAHPDVANAAVYPVSSEFGDEEVMATVTLREGAQLAARELLDFCVPRLTSFAVPRYLAFANELPLTENGKIKKYRLREEGITAATWDREACGRTGKSTQPRPAA